MRAGATALLAIFVASLGIGIAGENVIALFWSSQSQAFGGRKAHFTQDVWHIWKVNFLNWDVCQTVTGLVLVLILAALLRYTSLGRQIKATRVNPDLATIIGINANTIYLICFGIGTFLAGVAAFWYGVKFTVEPSMGQRPVIFAFVVAFLAGTASGPVRVFFTGIALGLIEHARRCGSRSGGRNTAVFVILFLYLISEIAARQEPVWLAQAGREPERRSWTSRSGSSTSIRS